jgi:MarR family transcriptional regulator, organic hydroperoxide resistance regulator
MERVEDCISFLVNKAVQQVTRRAREKLAPFKVTPTQYAILKILWERDGQSGAEIGQRLVIDSATVTGVADRLEAAGLVRRVADPEDRRVQRLFLTGPARVLQAPLDAAMDGLNAEVRREMGTDGPALFAALRRLGAGKG